MSDVINVDELKKNIEVKNKFNSDSRRYASRIDNFCKRFISII